METDLLYVSVRGSVAIVIETSDGVPRFRIPPLASVGFRTSKFELDEEPDGKPLFFRETVSNLGPPGLDVGSPLTVVTVLPGHSAFACPPSWAAVEAYSPPLLPTPIETLGARRSHHNLLRESGKGGARALRRYYRVS